MLGTVQSAIAAAQNAFYQASAGRVRDPARIPPAAQAQAFLNDKKRVAVAEALVFHAGNGYPRDPTPRACTKR